MIKSKKSGKKSKRPPESELEKMYSEMTAKEIAARYGVAEGTVRTWIREYRMEAILNAKED